MESTKIETVYVVIVSCECDDNYYPDYDHIHCICSTKEKAKEVADKLIEKNKNEDSYYFTGARVEEYVLDAIPY